MYEASGNRVATKVNNIWRYMVYDARGKLVAEYGKKSKGLVEETYPSTRKVKYTLDNNGDLSQVLSKKTSDHGYWAYADSFAYDKNGNMTRMQLGNGLWETFEYSADRLQIKKIGLGETSTVQDVLKLEYKYDTSGSSYDNNGSLREQKITVPGIEDPFIQTYTYDDLNRLSSATETNDSAQTWKQTFTIDRYGNRKFNTSGSNTTTLGSCPAAECNPEASTTRNRFSTDDGYEYDENGSLIENAKGERFTYDMENHQTEFFNESNSGSTPDATYHYDGDGRRVKKIAGPRNTPPN
ncbi:MAG: hypothetical protein IPM25_19710 [Chloracidobacterium sp.]|nr:hypothetical protein [Chloracidobacterium sp.]